MIKCAHCNKEIFGTDYKTKSKKRYHNECYEAMIAKAENKNQKKSRSLKNNEKDALLKYICELFEIKEIPYNIEKQIEDYVSFRNYTYTGIQKTLYYFYELEGNKVDDEYKGTLLTPISS